MSSEALAPPVELRGGPPAPGAGPPSGDMCSWTIFQSSLDLGEDHRALLVERHRVAGDPAGEVPVERRHGDVAEDVDREVVHVHERMLEPAEGRSFAGGARRRRRRAAWPSLNSVNVGPIQVERLEAFEVPGARRSARSPRGAARTSVRLRASVRLDRLRSQRPWRQNRRPWIAMSMTTRPDLLPDASDGRPRRPAVGRPPRDPFHPNHLLHDRCRRSMADHPGPTGDRPRPGPGPPRRTVLSYHVIVEGGCWTGLDQSRREDARASLALERGDVVLYPRGDAYFLAQDARASADG